jgi:hypothetical protein
MYGRFGVAVIVLAGVLGACGGGSDRGHPQSPIGATPGEIAGAAARTAAASSGRFEMSIVANGAGTDVSVRAHGSFDNRRHLYSLSTDAAMLVAGFAGPLEVIATPDTVYLRAPRLARQLRAPTEWIGARRPNDDQLVSRLVDPAGVLDLLQSGRATIAGAPAEVVVEDGLVRRITMRFDAAAGKEGAGSAVVSLQYSDFGAPVTIEPPSADQVTDETDVLEPLIGAKTGG